MGAANVRDDGGDQQYQRLSVDAGYDHAFLSSWRTVIANRLDVDWPMQGTGQHYIDTLEDAYISWTAIPGTILDIGRINIRNGVGLGYNPTDYFRKGAVRSIVSIDPVSLKENRQGSVALQSQTLWANGSATVTYSPKLASAADENGSNPGWGTTNDGDRWLITASEKLTDRFNAQLLVYKAGGVPLQVGVDATGLIGRSTVVYVECSVGRSSSLLEQTLAQRGLIPGVDDSFRDRTSAGFTYSTAAKINITAELEYNGAGLQTSRWEALWAGPAAIYALYRNQLLIDEEPPTRRAAFLYAVWQDALVNHLQFSAMERLDLDDHSHLSWLEARYHWPHIELALQWQQNSGQPDSDYGALTRIQSLQALLRYYF